MTLTTTQLIEYLRSSVKIQDPSVTVQDAAYLSMTDETIVLYMNIALSRNYPNTPSLDYLQPEQVFPLVLLTKKELFFALAVYEAPQFDIGADNNNYLKRSQRFAHYSSLIAQVQAEYEAFTKDGGEGGNTLTSYDVLLSSRYATGRNQDLGVTPSIILQAVNVQSSFVELAWSVKNLRGFLNYKVYVSTLPILDLFNLTRKIADTAEEVAVIQDRQQVLCRVEDLNPNTTYYFVVSVTDTSLHRGYQEITVTTLE